MSFKEIKPTEIKVMPGAYDVKLLSNLNTMSIVGRPPASRCLLGVCIIYDLNRVTLANFSNENLRKKRSSTSKAGTTGNEEVCTYVWTLWWRDICERRISIVKRVHLPETTWKCGAMCRPLRGKWWSQLCLLNDLLGNKKKEQNW